MVAAFERLHGVQEPTAIECDHAEQQSSGPPVGPHIQNADATNLAAAHGLIAHAPEFSTSTRRHRSSLF